MHRRSYIGFVGAALLAGCQSDGEASPTATDTDTPASTATATATDTPTATSTPTPTPEESIQVHVVYTDTWSGTIRTRSGGSVDNRSIADRSEQVIDIDTDIETLSVEVQKDDSSRRTLSIQLIHNGEVIDEDSTDEPFGEVSVSADFA